MKKHTLISITLSLILLLSVSVATFAGSCTVSKSCGPSVNDFVSCTSFNNDCVRASNGVKCDGEFTSCLGNQEEE